MRMPSLSEWSWRASSDIGTSVSVPALTRSAIFSITPPSPALRTPYGSSVTMIALLPPRLVVVRLEVDRVRVDVPEHLGRDTREPAFRVVTDEAVGQERVVIALDPKRVDRLDACVGDGFDLSVVVIASDERLDDAPN